MAVARSRSAKPAAQTPGKRSSRSKRELILSAATADFASIGYRASKWSDVADAVGIGSTALYHYFVSKDHCLFTIMAEVLGDTREHFHSVMESEEDPRIVIEQCIRYPLLGGSERADRHRVVMAEMHLLGLPHLGPDPEHAAYLDARGHAHDMVHDWTRYLDRCMREGGMPQQDPHLLARAVIGLGAYVYAWYGPKSKVPLSDVSDALVRHAMSVAFCVDG